MLNKKNILFVCTEDWFFKSHFIPLHEAVLSFGSEFNTVLISSTGNVSEGLKKMGIEVIPFDAARGRSTIFRLIIQVWQLTIHFRHISPQIMHFISLRVIILGGLISFLFPKTPKVYHLTGLGTLAEGRSFHARLVGSIVFRILPFLLKQPNSVMIVENPDDLKYLRNFGSFPDKKVNLIEGAGIDPEVWMVSPAPNNNVPRVAFVGRMIWTKGVDVLINAMKILHEKGIKLHLDLYGEPDQGNINQYSSEKLKEWDHLPNVTWHGRINDIYLVWSKTDFGVVPTRTREGMPRAMLEAASCCRPQIVTDVPGPRHFIRDGKEGFIVPPEDPHALADALAKLASDVDLRRRMGQSARQRIFEGYTENQIRAKVSSIYQRLLLQIDKVETSYQAL